jgi:hypothetical protein
MRAGAYPVILKVSCADGRTMSVAKPAFITVRGSTVFMPQLSIKKGVNSVTLSWQSELNNLVLECTGSLFNPEWTVVPFAAIHTEPDLYMATIPVASQQYYRLRKP